MLKALAALDKKLPGPVTLLVGGGSAILLRHGIPISTADIDALILSSEVTPAEIDPLVKAVACELDISPHWYNDYFNTFTYSLPKDFRERLSPVYEGNKLRALALGKEDLLIMKCFAGREKDVGHARALIRKGVDEKMVTKHMEVLSQKGIPGSETALQFLSDLFDEIEGRV